MSNRKLFNIAGQFRLTAYLSYLFSLIMVIALLAELVSLAAMPDSAAQRRGIVTQIVIQLVLIGVLAVLGTVIGFTMRARIRRSVKGVAQVMNDASAGNFTSRARLYSKDEIAALSSAVNESMEALNALVLRLREGGEILDSFADASSGQAETVKDSNRSVLEGSRLLSQTGTQLNDVAGTLTDSGAEVAQDIANLSGVARENERLRVEGLETAGELDQAVHELTLAVEHILGLMQDIATISGQTNMLALNATIEAARAGEAGRGFHVVANQAKDLSAQTSETTSQVLTQVAQLEKRAAAGGKRISQLLEQLHMLSETQAQVTADVEVQQAALSEANAEIDRVRDLSGQMFSHAEDMTALTDASMEQSKVFADHMQVLVKAVSALSERVSRFEVR